jgi:hypothetical protein
MLPRADRGCLMPPQRQRKIGDVQRITLTRDEAAAALGMSTKHFARHVQPHIRIVPSGQLILVPVKELERWCEQRAHYLAPQTAA